MHAGLRGNKIFAIVFVFHRRHLENTTDSASGPKMACIAAASPDLAASKAPRLHSAGEQYL